MWKWIFALVGLVLALLYNMKVSQQPSVIVTLEKPLPANLSEEDIATFRRDGFILKKGIVAGDQLKGLVTAGENLYQSHSLLDLVFAPSFAKLAMQVWRQNPEFARVAFQSSFPSITAKLMGEEDPIRILKDGFFGFKGKSNVGCGFHVDDKVFWPARDDSGGVNFWLALSPMRISEGGGIRVVNQSLAQPFADECKQVIREGADYNRTCRMEELSPSCHERLLANSVVYDMEPGDALIWDRWTFHRSEPFQVETNEHKLRYTIRYVPASATAEGRLHESVQVGEKFHGPYYPQVWPEAVREEVDAINAGIGADFALSPRTLLYVVRRKLGLLAT